MNKHTPGPWKIRRLGKSQTIVELGPVCADEYAGSCWLDVSESDASLVCAAPDLLEALEGMLEIYGVREQHMSREPFASSAEVDCCNQARAAISKARGEA